jgi:hypothetical protein
MKLIIVAANRGGGSDAFGTLAPTGVACLGFR